MGVEKIIRCIIVIICVGSAGNSIASNIAILGTGYVGLISGACFAESGHRVVCLDTDRSKIEMLNQGVVPIYEPGLKDLITNNVLHKRLFFTVDIEYALKEADYIFIAVGTPMDAQGCADLSAVESAFSMITPYLNRYKTICIKSTVPIGTGDRLLALLDTQGIDPEMYDLISNPEFLREGSAINDFMRPDRVVVGVNSERARNCMHDLYRFLIQENVPCLFTSIATAETIKYASNAFLATKLSFINEIANLCDKTGADILDVAYGMGLDNRIGHAFLKPGPGFGGSCFPKDCHALVNTSTKYGACCKLVETALLVNEEQKRKPIEKLLKLLDGDIMGKTIAVLGLAFKKNTDDIRYSPAITLLDFLVSQGVRVKAYDPVAMNNMKKLFPMVSYENCLYDAAQGAHAVIIITEWDEFRNIDLARLGNSMMSKVLIDARNLLDPIELQQYSFSYATIGRSESI